MSEKQRFGRILIILTLILSDCNISFVSMAPDGNPLPLSAAIVKNYSLHILDYEELPLTGFAPASLTGFLADDMGVILHEYGGSTYYHPLKIARKILLFLDNYRSTGKEEYLSSAEAHAAKLLELGVEEDGAIYLPYPFDFELHGNSGDVLRAPWYSGMTQGQALMGFVRLYQATGNPIYLSAAESILRSFYRVEGEAEPWTASVDPNGYYWIDEYPLEQNTFTLNGHIYAIMGLYEMWILQPSPELERILRAAITTIEYYIEQFRDPGQLSRYCLKHGTKSEHYHEVHIGQLAFLQKITNEAYFLEISEIFQSDF